MTRYISFAVGILVAAGCNGVSSTSSTVGAASTVGTGSSTGKAAASASSGAVASSGGSGGGLSSSNTSGTSGGTTGGPPPCTWVGDSCVVPTCGGQPLGEPCALEPFGTGLCINGNCIPENLQTDPNNCGAFGLVCPEPGQCTPNGQGEAYCQVGFACLGVCPGSLICNQSTAGCVLSTCTADTAEEACAADAGGVGACCGSTCLDVHGFDSQNCGNCGLACPAGQLCAYGSCVPSADCSKQPNDFCGLDGGVVGECCGGGCVDTTSDFHNCSSCGQACPSGATCVRGGCVTRDGGASACTSDGGCDPGYGCWSGTCLLAACGALNDQENCIQNGAQGECCGQACVDPTIDSSNCGGCGITCGSGTTCVEGRCAVSCLFGISCALDAGGSGTCCDSVCVDTSIDVGNCGGCGLGCPNGAACAALSGSDGGPSAQCQSSPGVAASCAADSDCPQGRACAQGQCLPAACVGLEGAPCAADAGTGLVEGACCGSSCLAPSDGGGCGGCGPDLQQCYEPFESPIGVVVGICCGGQCVDNVYDPNNCGVCGNACASGICNVYTERCFETQPSTGCQETCGPGTACDGLLCVGGLCAYDGNCLAEDGTIAQCCPDNSCPDLLTDPSNCGLCGVSCPAGQTCNRGVCSGAPQCTVGRLGTSCPLDGGLSGQCCAGLGCIDTRFNAENCGDCGMVCPDGESCMDGQCD